MQASIFTFHGPEIENGEPELRRVDAALLSGQRFPEWCYRPEPGTLGAVVRQAVEEVGQVVRGVLHR